VVELRHSKDLTQQKLQVPQWENQKELLSHKLIAIEKEELEQWDTTIKLQVTWIISSIHFIPFLGESAFKYDENYKKPDVPRVQEKPIMGLKTQKNYIVANAVENMLSQPKVIEGQKKFVEKKEYGKVPKYLENIKDQMNREYEHIKTVHIQEEEARDNEKFLMSEEELRILREGLKKKWEIVNKEYQQITHISKIDTVGLKRK